MENNKVIRIGIVDDHQIVIDGLKAALSNFPRVEIVATTTDGHEMLQKLAKLSIDVLLTDLIMPQINGQELCAIIRRDFPSIAIIALSMNGEGAVIHQLIDLRLIDGYLLKYCGIKELISAIEIIGNGGQYFQEEVLAELSNYNKIKHSVFEIKLTSREKQIIVLMEKDYSNKQIASQLNISVRTVETHRKNIFRKTNTNNLLGLVKWAYEHKIL